MTNRVKETGRIIVSVATGVMTASFILTLFQVTPSGVFPPLEGHDPEAFYKLQEYYEPFHIRNEIMGLCLGTFTGSFISGWLSRTRMKTCTLSVPFLLVLLISTIIWPFHLQKELIWLALPVWILIALIAYYIARFIKIKTGKEKLNKLNIVSFPPGTASQ